MDAREGEGDGTGLASFGEVSGEAETIGERGVEEITGTGPGEELGLSVTSMSVVDWTGVGSAGLEEEVSGEAGEVGGGDAEEERLREGDGEERARGVRAIARASRGLNARGVSWAT